MAGRQLDHALHLFSLSARAEQRFAARAGLSRAYASSRKRVYRILEIVPTIAQTRHYANNVAESCVKPF
jgi:hypothetical protein